MTLSQADFDYIRTLVHKHAAIVLEPEKGYLAETRLLPLARSEGLDSLNGLVERLKLEPPNGLHQKVVEAMTTNETSFFRDLHPFEAIRKIILPELIRNRSAEQRLNIWCGAASSGQEPYSLALLLCEHFPMLTSWNVRLLASDLSQEMLRRAKSGRFSQLEVNRGLSAHLLIKYFTKHGLEWYIREDIRARVEFSAINLIEPWPPLPPLDLILLRNVLIYFDTHTKKQVLGRVRQVLRPDGYLFLGGAETTLNLDDAFERVELERFSCYRLRKS